MLPDETQSLVIQPGRDLCTLVTCTPYGVNSHRLLVHAERCEVPDEWLNKDAEETFPDGYAPVMDRTIVPSVLLGLLLAAVIIGVTTLILRRRKRRATAAAVAARSAAAHSRRAGAGVVRPSSGGNRGIRPNGGVSTSRGTHAGSADVTRVMRPANGKGSSGHPSGSGRPAGAHYRSKK